MVINFKRLIISAITIGSATAGAIFYLIRKQPVYKGPTLSIEEQKLVRERKEIEKQMSKLPKIGKEERKKIE